MAVIDVITYNGEEELFDLRYNILKDKVDEFRVVEFDATFSGKTKESTFDQFHKNVNYFFVTKETWRKYRQLAIESPNTDYGKGANHWITEFAQKESIKDCLTDLEDDDIVYIGDCDEIWDSDALEKSWRLFSDTDELPFKLLLRVYTYWLNNASSEEFWGTIVSRYKGIKNECLNQLRTTNHIKSQVYFGWHFTSLAPYLRKKLEDSYTKETYASQQFLDNLSSNIESNKDFLGRNFTYKIDESNWPEYLKQHKKEFSQLCLKNR